jgi:hypothetical protein
MAKSKINYDIEPTSVKVVKGIGVLLVIGCVAWFVLHQDTSSPASRQDLIGTWKMKDGSTTGYLEIHDDGTYSTRLDGPYAAHRQFLDFANGSGRWTWQNDQFVVGDGQGVTLKSFTAKNINHGKKLRLDQVDYNYYVEFERSQ